MADYTLAAASPASGLINTASGNFTVTWGGGPSSDAIITPHSTNGGLFLPATLSIATSDATAHTFTFTPFKYGATQITTTNNIAGVNPAGVVYTCNPGVATYSGTGQDAYTVIKNTSGVQKTFSFIGPRGVTLAINEEYSFPGDPLVSPWLRFRQRDYYDFLRALEKGVLTIISTPAKLLKDSTSKQVKKLVLANSVLGTADPSWGAFADGF